MLINGLSLKSSIDAHSLADELQELQHMIVNSSGSKGSARDAPSPPGSKFFQLHAVFGKFWQNRMLAPPGELAPPPRGNPGSATGEAYPLGFLAEPKQNFFENHSFHKYVYILVFSRCFKKKKVSDLCGNEWSSWLKHRKFVIVWMYFPNSNINKEIKTQNT